MTDAVEKRLHVDPFAEFAGHVGTHGSDERCLALAVASVGPLRAWRPCAPFAVQEFEGDALALDDRAAVLPRG